MQKSLFNNTTIMVSAKSYKRLKLLINIFQLFLLLISVSSFAQTTQSYRHHEEIEVGNGMKVEILSCVGEGPTEECDCIYFKDKRQNGTRTKQNANRLKEEERAAYLAKSLQTNISVVKKNNSFAASHGDRSDLTIPLSITVRSNKPVLKQEPTIEEAARQADAVAKARSDKMKETVLKDFLKEDSAEMDKVYIPAVVAGNSASVGIAKADSVVIQKDTIAGKKVVADSVLKTSIDSAEQNWVKQYQHVNANVISAEHLVDTAKQLEAKISDTTVNTNVKALQSVPKNETKSLDSIVKPAVDSAKENMQEKGEKVKQPPSFISNVDSTSEKTISEINSTVSKNEDIDGKTAKVNLNSDWMNATISGKESGNLYKVGYITSYSFVLLQRAHIPLPFSLSSLHHILQTSLAIMCAINA